MDLFRLPVLLLALVWSAAPAGAQGIPLIRDAEIERMVRDFAEPIWEAAGLSPNAVQVHIVNDNTLNAFVAGGQRIFVNTGLLTSVDTPNQLIGVLAHETGHITGGHLARTQDALQNASTVAIVSMLAGLATVAAGAGDAGAALMMSSSEFAGRNFLAYSRTQESAADQAGLNLLERTGQSGRGLIQFLSHLGEQRALLTKNQDPYIQSHPLTNERIARLRNKAEQARHWDNEDDPEDVRRLKRAQAKIMGYMEPERALQQYSADDPSIEARYGRAFALYRQSMTDDALALVDGLLAERPEDPYFYELKGQILFESGEAEKSQAPLAEAISLLPDEPLLRVLYGQTLLSSNDNGEIPEAQAREAIDNLKAASLRDDGDPNIWNLLAQAYHSTGNEPMADLATAEQYLLTGRTAEAVHLANRAVRGLERGTPSWWRAQDIVFIAESNGVGAPENRRTRQNDRPLQNR